MFSDLLKTLRDQKHVSQTQLAKEIGVSAGNVSDWETGRSKPGYIALKELSRFFGLSADYLLELTDRAVKTGGLSKLIATCDGTPLSQLEKDIIAMLRLLNEHDRKIAMDFIAMLYEQTTGEKGSIYLTYTSAEGGPGENDSLLSSESSSGTA